MTQSIKRPKSITNAVNGVHLMLDEPLYYLEQAHGVACLLQDGISSDELSKPIMEGAARAVTTLIALATISYLNEVSA